MLLPNYPMELIHPLMVYGSVILAFFGAMHWELAIEKLNVEDRNGGKRRHGIRGCVCRLKTSLSRIS